MNNLATIQHVKNIRPCPNSDNLDIVQVLGWQVVTKRGEYSIGDLAVYIAIDTILPDRPEFEFLRNKNFRIKPIRLRGMNSAGICFPLSILPQREIPYAENEDVTSILNVVHYEKPVPAELAGQAFGQLPGFLIQTDELNLRTYPDAIQEMWSRPYYISRKYDGCSGTFFIRNGEFGVTSRRVHLKENETNGFWRIARKYDIENALRKAFPDKDIAIQGEVYGEGIAKNPLGIKGISLSVFNLFDIKTGTYLSYADLSQFTKNYNIPMVHTIEEGNSFHYTLDELIKLSNEQKYPTNGPAEGIVIRPQDPFYSRILRKYWSGKIINENYKEKD